MQPSAALDPQPHFAGDLRPASLWESFRIQLRVIKALLMREILTRFGRHNIGFFWLFIEPMIYVALHPLIWAFQEPTRFGAMTSWGFAVTGFCPFVLWRNMASRCIHAVEPNRALLLHGPVKIVDLFLSRIFLEALGATVALVVLAGLLTFLGLMDLPYDPLQVSFGWLLMGWFGASLALFVGGFAEKTILIEKLWPPLILMLVVTSGTFYLADQLPPAAREILMWVPPLHATEYIREGYFGAAANFHYDLAYLSAWNLVLFISGLWQIKMLGRRANIL